MIPARYKGGPQPIKALVIHGTVSSDNAGTARAIAKWWAGSTSPKTSCHYVVDPKEVIQSVGDHTVAFHCGSNYGCIGIELCDEQAGSPDRWKDADSQAIIKRAARLAAELCLAYNIAPIRPTISALKTKGKHGIYGHNDSRLAFGNTSHTDPRDFPWTQFLTLVKSEIAKIKAAAAGLVKPPATAKKTHRVHAAHISLQTQDPLAQRKRDIQTALSLNYNWVTGTEALDRPTRDALIANCKRYGYTFYAAGGQDSWIAVKNSIIKPGTKITRYYSGKIIDGVAGAWPNQGVMAFGFTHAKAGVGHITVIACHMQTKGQPYGPADRRIRLAQNKRLTAAIGAYAKKVGAGSSLVFYGGDQNIDDAVADTFLDQDFMSCWDDRIQYPNTHGTRTIDVIARWEPDLRVRKCASARVIPLPLYGDHEMITASYDIELLAA